jgi:membrane protease YdiL (CAAX protease family)
MKEFIKKHIRSCGRISDQFIIGFILAFLLTALGELVGLIVNRLIRTVLYSNTGPEPAFMTTFLQYFAFIGIWITLITAMLGKRNRPMLGALGRKLSGNNLRMSLLGALIGFAANAFCVGMSILLKDLSLYFNHFSIGIFLLLLFGVFVQSAAEEIVMRCYYYEKLRRRYKNPAIALFCTAVCFAAMHLGNPGMTAWGLIQIAVVGILFAVLVHYYNSLWAAFWVHTAWNFTQSIIFGLPNSGIVVPYSHFMIDSASTGFFFHAANGVEGSPGACLVLALVTVILFVIAKKRNLQPHDLWTEQEAEADARIAAEEAVLAAKAE